MHMKRSWFSTFHIIFTLFCPCSVMLCPCLSWEHSHVATQVMGNNYLPGSECQWICGKLWRQMWLFSRIKKRIKKAHLRKGSPRIQNPASYENGSWSQKMRIRWNQNPAWVAKPVRHACRLRQLSGMSKLKNQESVGESRWKDQTAKVEGVWCWLDDATLPRASISPFRRTSPYRKMPESGCIKTESSTKRNPIDASAKLVKRRRVFVPYQQGCGGPVILWLALTLTLEFQWYNEASFWKD